MVLAEELRWNLMARHQMTKTLLEQAGQPCPDCAKYGYQWHRCPVSHDPKGRR